MTRTRRTAALTVLLAGALVAPAAAAPAGDEYLPNAPSATGKDEAPARTGGGGGDSSGGSGSGSSTSSDGGSSAIGSSSGSDSGSGGTEGAGSKDAPKAKNSLGAGASSPSESDSGAAVSSPSDEDDGGALDGVLSPLPLALIGVALILATGLLLRRRKRVAARQAGPEDEGRRAAHKGTAVPDPKRS